LFKIYTNMKNYKSGNFQNQGYYKSFQPSLINKHWLLDDMEIQQLLSKADTQLGRLDMYSGTFQTSICLSACTSSKKAAK
jgi:hypothetical protein